MKVLLSIKPEYAFKIFEGSKKFEFRKSIFKKKNVSKIVVYASSPVMKVIGEFEINRVLMNSPDEIWEKTKSWSGISKDFFDSYFEGKDKAYAIEVKKTTQYKKAKCLKEDFQINFAPQSFVYLK